MCPCDQGCAYAIEGCQRISGGVSRKLLTNIRSNTIGFLYYLMAVLVAISIPIFTSQLEKSREATDIANVRSAYAEVVTKYLENPTAEKLTMSVSAHQRVADWQTQPTPELVYQGNGVQGTYTFAAKTSGSYSVTLTPADDGTVTPSVN